MLNKSMQFWKDQAQEIDALIKGRYEQIERITLIEQVKYWREKAEMMEEWKDKVEFQCQGLEKQVGELEAQRCALESELKKGWIHKFLAWVKKKFFPEGSLRRRILAKIKCFFSCRKNKQ